MKINDCIIGIMQQKPIFNGVIVTLTIVKMC